MRAHLVVAGGLSVLLLTACGSSDSPGSPSPTPTSSASAGAGTGPTASPTTSGGTDATLPADLRTRPAVAAAIADTATREKVDPGQVDIAAWSPVTWNDGSLGCPTKGKVYTQATVPGELLMLRVGSGMFQYHAKTAGPFTYCATPSAAYTVG